MTLHNSFNDADKSWAYKVTKAFLEADIPLHKLKAKSLINLFNEMNRPLPSQTNARGYVQSISNNIIHRCIQHLSGAKCFLVIDETEIDGSKFVNTLVGSISEPNITYLVDCQLIDSSPNTTLICQIIDDNIQRMKIQRPTFLLLISDAAPYMIAAGKALEVFYPRLIHVTCISHLLHNCALRIKSYYNDVNNLISSIKAALTKNNQRQELFKGIGMPPKPIITRWASWLNTAEYHAEYFVAIKEIVEKFEDDGIIVTRAKESIRNPTVANSLREIVHNYSILAKLIILAESDHYTIECGLKELADLHFTDDPCQIKNYIEARLMKNGILKIKNMEKESITPMEYSLLMNCQPTSASVERSFSMLNKLLAKDRNFATDNIKYYIIVMYNKF